MDKYFKRLKKREKFRPSVGVGLSEYALYRSLEYTNALPSDKGKRICMSIPMGFNPFVIRYFMRDRRQAKFRK